MNYFLLIKIILASKNGIILHQLIKFNYQREKVIDPKEVGFLVNEVNAFGNFKDLKYSFTINFKIK